MEENVSDGLVHLVSYPEGFSPEKKYPLIVFLHGAGSRAETTEILRRNKSFSYIRAHQNERGFIILAPLC